MTALRRACCRLGRVLLAASVMCSAPITTEGEALVLHEHGTHRPHLHIVGRGDLLSSTVGSSMFGHSAHPEPMHASEPERVRILLVIPTGSRFISTPRLDDVVDGLTSLREYGFSTDGPPAAPGTDSITACLGRNASTAILRRNHALLI